MKEEKLLNEVKRIQGLMGVNIITERKEYLSWAKGMSPAAKAAIVSVGEILTKMRSSGTWKQSDIDNLCKKLEDLGVAADDISDLKITMKEFLESTAKSADSGFYKHLEDVYRASDPPGLVTLKKMAQLTADDLAGIQKWYDDLIQTSLKSGGLKNKINYYVTFYKAILKNWSINREKTLSIITSREDIYIAMEKDLLIELYGKVKLGKLTPEVAEEIFEILKKAFREDAELDKVITDMEQTGMVGTKQKGTPLKYGDPTGTEIDSIFDEAFIETPVSSTDDITRTIEKDGIKKTESLEDDTLTRDYNSAKSKETPTNKEKDLVDTVDEWKNNSDIEIKDVKAKIQNQPPEEVYSTIDDIAKRKAAGETISEAEENLLKEYDNWKSSKRGGGLNKQQWEKLSDDALAAITGLDKLGKNFQRYGIKWQQKYIGIPFITFYEVWLRPTYEWFIPVYDIIFTQSWKKFTGNKSSLFETMSARFDEAMSKGYSEYMNNFTGIQTTKSASNFSKGALRRIQNNLSKLKSEGLPIKGQTTKNGKLVDVGFGLEEMWEAYKTNVRKKIAETSAEDAQRFDDFCKIIDEDQGTFSWYLSTKEILEEGFPAPNGGSPSSAGKTLTQKIYDLKNKQVSEIIDQQKLLGKWEKFVGDYWPSVSAKVLGGSLRSPKSLRRYLLKEGYTFNAAGWNYVSTIFATAILVGFLSFISNFLYAIYQGSFEDLKNEYVEKYGKDYWSIFGGITYDAFINQGILGTLPVEKFQSKLDEGWVSALTIIVPGWVDNSVAALIVKSENITKTGEFTEKELIIKSANDKVILNVNTRIQNKNAEVQSRIYEEGSKINFLNTIKKESDELYEFMKDKVTFIKEFPKDYVIKYKEKTSGMGKDMLINLINNKSLDMSTIEIPDDQLEYGSVVAIGASGKKYKLMRDAMNQTDFTEDDFNLFKKNNKQIMYVKPDFDSLDFNTTRTFHTIEDFKNNYDNL